MAFFGRLPSYYKSLEESTVQVLEAFARNSVLGDFVEAHRIWRDELSQFENVYVVAVQHVDCLIRQCRYGDVFRFVEQTLDHLRAPSSVPSEDERQLLMLAKAYAGVFVFGSLRYALLVAENTKNGLLRSPDSRNDVHIFAMEIYLRLVKYARFHSTFLSTKPGYLDFETSDARAPVRPKNGSGDSEWSHCVSWILSLAANGYALSAISILGILSSVLEESVVRECYEAIETSQPPPTSISNTVNAVTSMRAQAALGRYLISRGKAPEGNEIVTTSSSSFQQRFPGGIEAAPRLAREVDLARFEASMPHPTAAAAFATYSTLARLSQQSNDWAMEDYCRGEALFIAAKTQVWPLMRVCEKRLEELLSTITNDHDRLLTIKCTTYHASNQESHAPLLKWFRDFDLRHPISDSILRDPSSQPLASEWDLPASRAREQKLMYLIYQAAGSRDCAGTALANENRILRFMPPVEILQRGTADEDGWYLEWTSTGSQTTCFKVLADRIRSGINQALQAPHKPPEISHLFSLLSSSNEWTEDEARDLFFNPPFQQALFDRRVEVLKVWFDNDPSFRRDASQLLIAQILMTSQAIPFPEQSPDEKLHSRRQASRSFVAYAQAIESASVKSFLRRNVLISRTQLVESELEHSWKLGITQTEDSLSSLKQECKDLLSEYQSTYLAGQLSQIGTLYAILAEIELRSGPGLAALETFKQLLQQSESYFDTVRSYFNVVPGSVGLEIRSRVSSAAAGNRRLLTRAIELLVVKFLTSDGVSDISQQTGKLLWETVQRSKNRALQDTFNKRHVVPVALMKRINALPEAKSLFEAWASAFKTFKDASDGVNADASDASAVQKARDALEEQERELSVSRHNCLREAGLFIQSRPVSGENMSRLLRVFGSDDPLLVDWFVCNKTTPEYTVPGKLYMIVLKPGTDVAGDLIRVFEMEAGIGPKAQAWVQEYLLQPRADAKLETPAAYEDLQKLRPLIAPLGAISEPGQRMIFCPTSEWGIHRIPLHALEVGGDSGGPESLLLRRNKITYTHNHTFLAVALSSRMAEDASSTTDPSFIGRIYNTQCPDLTPPRRPGQSFSASRRAIEAMAARIAASVPGGQPNNARGIADGMASSTSRLASVLGCTPLTNTAVTPASLLAGLQDADLTHLLGHVARGTREAPLEASICFESQTADDNGGTSPSLSAQRILNEASVKEGAHISMLSCRGGVAQSVVRDEVLGLMPALMACGARSILAPLWEIRMTDAVAWTNSLCDAVSAAGSGGADHLLGFFDLADACRAASLALLQSRGTERVGAWAGMVFYGAWQSVAPMRSRQSRKGPVEDTTASQLPIRPG